MPLQFANGTLAAAQLAALGAGSPSVAIALSVARSTDEICVRCGGRAVVV
jgi:hypothetical protein